MRSGTTWSSSHTRRRGEGKQRAAFSLSESYPRLTRQLSVSGDSEPPVANPASHSRCCFLLKGRSLPNQQRCEVKQWPANEHTNERGTEGCPPPARLKLILGEFLSLSKPWFSYLRNRNRGTCAVQSVGHASPFRLRSRFRGCGTESLGRLCTARSAGDSALPRLLPLPHSCSRSLAPALSHRFF